MAKADFISTTVEILNQYLTLHGGATSRIYNSRNFNSGFDDAITHKLTKSTTVEILNQYLTAGDTIVLDKSTTVEILNQYLTAITLPKA